jgi:hypothetical protein
MDCRRTQELIPLFVGYDLDPRKGNLVSDHVKCCQACRQVLSEFKESQSLLKSYVPREFDAAYFEQIKKAVLAGIEDAGKLPVLERMMRRLWSVRLPIAVGALLIVVTGVALILLRSGARDGRTKDKIVVVDGAGGKPDVPSVPARGPTALVDRRRGAPVRKISGKTAHRVHPAEAGLARIIGSPNPIAPGFEEPGEVSSDSNQRDQLRIYIQTNDPNIRIIWFVPKPFVPKALVPKSDDGD